MPLHCNAKRVLLVDDEEGIRRLFRVVLSSGIPECSVDIAGNGVEALEAFGRNHHAVLLLDLHMPIMDGQSAFGEIEKLCSVRDWEMPAVVFCTGFAPPENVIRMLQSHSEHGLLLKPVNSEVLINTIRSRLAKR
jgi:CheY-like chemotaxis protein